MRRDKFFHSGLKSKMTKTITIEQKAEQIRRAFKDDLHGPFPYDGCRKLLREKSGTFQHLISDLDMYFSGIAGYASWGKKILGWTDEKIREVRQILGVNFFDMHPQYKPLEAMITEEETPDLYHDLMNYERVRKELLELLSRLSSERGEEVSGGLLSRRR